MNTLFKTALLLLAILVYMIPASAQDELSIEQAVFGYGLYAQSAQLVWRSNELIEKENNEWMIYSDDFKKKSSWLTLDDLNKILEDSGLTVIKRMPAPDFTDDGRIRMHTSDGVVLLDPNNPKKNSCISIHKGSENITICPDYQRYAYTSGNNVFYQDTDGSQKQVSFDNSLGIVNGQSISRSEFGISGGLFWSPNGRYIAYYKKDESNVKTYPLVHVTTRMAEEDPIPYPMAGMESEQVWVGIYDTKTAKSVLISDHTFGKDQYLTNLTWGPESNYIYLAVLNRGQDHMKLKQYDVITGLESKILFEEKALTYVEPLQELQFLPHQKDQFIWFSEKNGFDHMYLYNTDGELIKQLTNGEFVVTKNFGFDTKGRFLYYMSTEESPLESHLYQLDTKSGKTSRLTVESGTHRIKFNEDKTAFTDHLSNYSTASRDMVTTVKKGKTEVLSSPDNPELAAILGKYTPFTTKSSDGTTDLYGYYILPPDFDPAKTYPMIIYVYGGPHAQLVHNQWLGGARGWQYFMAQKGYIAMTVDNRGSDGRGRDFEHIIHRKLGTYESEDQLAAVNFMLEQGFVAQDRIGVHGWSYGGFMTTTLMTDYSDIFSVGVAGGPVIDWKYYEIMYGERYMDTPQENAEGYAGNSLLNKAKFLKGDLMLIHGTVDPTVVWQNSLSFVEKCIEEKILIDYMVYPEHPHNVRGQDRVHLMRTVTRYFEKNL